MPITTGATTVVCDCCGLSLVLNETTYQVDNLTGWVLCITKKCSFGMQSGLMSRSFPAEKALHTSTTVAGVILQHPGT